MKIAAKFADTPLELRRRLGFALCAAAIAGAFIAAFRSPDAEFKTVEQVEFDDWFFEAEQAIQTNREVPIELPVISVTIKSADAEPKQWTLDPILRPELKEEVARVLALVREAGLLSVTEDEEISNDPTQVTVVIQGKDQNFRSTFSPAQIERNVQAQLFLKLFELYATAPSNAPIMARPAENEPQPEG